VTADDVLAVRGLVAGYGGAPVVHGIDLNVRAGEVVALLGANGAGKSTTLLALSGLVGVLSGEVELFGRPQRPTTAAREVGRRARAGLAHVPEGRALFPALTARQTVRLAVPRRAGAAAVDEVVGWFPGLARVLDRPAAVLSGGQQQMLALARALVARPRALMIDEMSLGLAPVVIDALLPVVRAAATETGAGVLLVEQHLPAALAIADRAYVLRRGRIVAQGDAATLGEDVALLTESYLGAG